MKKLRNIAIYYILFGVLCALSFVAFQLWRILIVGAILLVVFLILRFVFRIKTLPPKLTKEQTLYITIFLYALPILFTFFVFWYAERPFRQTVIIPENYEGPIAIVYNQPNGQRQWTGGFLGIGASRFIKVDTSGIAFTQFKYHNTNIEFLNISPPDSNNGLKIYFKNDLKNKIPYKEYPKSMNYKNRFEIYLEKGLPVAYMINNPPLIMIFVIAKSSNYHKYFMNEEEKKDFIKQENIRDPHHYIEVPRHKLKSEYNNYYDLKEIHYKKLR